MLTGKRYGTGIIGGRVGEVGGMLGESWTLVVSDFWGTFGTSWPTCGFVGDRFGTIWRLDREDELYQSHSIAFTPKGAMILGP